MTTPDVPIRLEFSVEVTGTPEQVWEAIATARGLSSWFLPTAVDERAGGALLTHMGDTDIPATITGWEPPNRLVYEEPEWAALMGHPDAEVTPLASEFLVEARSGGTCVVRVVSSAFGTGADWEQEAVDSMAEGWVPFFEHLRVYLAHFPGQRAATFSVDAKMEASVDQVRVAMRERLGVDEVGQTIELDGRTGVVEEIAPTTLVRLTSPVPGYVRFWSWEVDGHASAQVMGYLFPSDGSATAEHEEQAWTEWLTSLDVGAEARP